MSKLSVPIPMYLTVAYLGFFQGGYIQFLIDIQFTHILYP